MGLFDEEGDVFVILAVTVTGAMLFGRSRGMIVCS